jgi:hypothetical protein
MKKESKEMLKIIISNQELIMKALKIEVPVKVLKTEITKNAQPVKKQTVKKVEAKMPAKKAIKK